MKQYNYNALDETGSEHRGMIEGYDQNMVLGELRQRGLYVINLAENIDYLQKDEGNKEAMDELVALMPVSTSNKVFLFKQLALMLRSGMSITEAFDIIVLMQKGRIKQIAHSINRTIKSGEPFSSALSEFESVFSRMSVHMIRSAETSGELDVALIRIARYMEHKHALKKQVLSAMMYPAFTLLAAILVFIFMIVVIIPRFEEFLRSSGKKIPPATQLMVDIGNFFTANWMVLLVVAAIAVVAFVITYKREKGRLMVDSALVYIPVIGGVIKASAMAQLSWGLSILLKSGVPVVESLRIISDMIGNRLITQGVKKAADKVLHGAELSESFKQPGISDLIVQLMAVGERSGNLVQIMDEASEYYEDDLQSRTKTLANLVEPISILLIGGIVGFVYYGFFQALMSVSTGR